MKEQEFEVSHDYYYRVDSWCALRRLDAEDGFFRPRRWDSHSRPWPHDSLLKSRKTLESGQGIYRISFWRTLKPALNDLCERNKGLERYLMLRIPKQIVREILKDWSFENDDYLPNDADLIWRVDSVDGSEESFYKEGIDLVYFEVSQNGERWQGWGQANELLPDRVRLSPFGWQPVLLKTKQANAIVTAYWCALTSHKCNGIKGTWYLVTLDSEAQGNLGNDSNAINSLVEFFDLNSYATDVESVGGVLTVHLTKERFWTAQYVFDLRPVVNQGWLICLGQKLGLISQRFGFDVKLKNILTEKQEKILIKSSRLLEAKPEFIKLENFG